MAHSAPCHSAVGFADGTSVGSGVGGCVDAVAFVGFGAGTSVGAAVLGTWRRRGCRLAASATSALVLPRLVLAALMLARTGRRCDSSSARASAAQRRHGRRCRRRHARGRRGLCAAASASLRPAEATGVGAGVGSGDGTAVVGDGDGTAVGTGVGAGVGAAGAASSSILPHRGRQQRCRYRQF